MAFSEESRQIIRECVHGGKEFVRARMSGVWITAMEELNTTRLGKNVYGRMFRDLNEAGGRMYVVLCDDIAIGWESANGWRAPAVFYGVGVSAYQNVLRWAIAHPVKKRQYTSL